MAKGTTSSALFILLIASILAATCAADCMNDVNLLRDRCLQYVSASGPMTPPDSNCCNAIQRADVPCVCTYLTPEVAMLISADKLIYVAKQCGRALKPGSKCGSVVVHG